MMAATTAQTPLYASCPHCKQTVQCYGNGTVKLSAHHDKHGKGENCKGSDQVADSPRPNR